MEKLFPNPLDKARGVCYNNKAFARAEHAPRASASRKKFLKKFKKRLDRGGEVWYNNRVAQPSGDAARDWSLKIEQQKSTKHNLCTHERVKNDSTILFNQSK